MYREIGRKLGTGIEDAVEAQNIKLTEEVYIFLTSSSITVSNWNLLISDIPGENGKKKARMGRTKYYGI